MTQQSSYTVSKVRLVGNNATADKSRKQNQLALNLGRVLYALERMQPWSLFADKHSGKIACHLLCDGNAEPDNFSAVLAIQELKKPAPRREDLIDLISALLVQAGHEEIPYYRGGDPAYVRAIRPAHLSAHEELGIIGMIRDAMQRLELPHA